VEIKLPMYISKSGKSAPINLGVDVDPWNRENENCSDVWYEGVIGVAWTYQGQEFSFFSPEKEGHREKIMAYPTPDMQYMVVVYEEPTENIVRPDNAVVLNAKGEVHCQLRCPNPERLAGFEVVTWTKDSRFLQVDFEQKRSFNWMETRLLKVPEFIFTDEVVGTWRL